VDGDERMRLFCAFRLPEETVDELAAWQEAHLRGGRIVPPENLHVTLAFLGSRRRADVEPVLSALASVPAPGPIVFAPRSYRETRSVGMIVLDDAGGNGTRVAQGLHARLDELGLYRPERRRWLPHVTVLRFGLPPRLRPPLPDLGRFSPSDAALYHSVLRSSGAQYVVLDSVALGG
jgi:2'-5' RNA ligase